MNRYAAAVLLLIALSIVAAVSCRVLVGDVLGLPSDVSNFFGPRADVSNANAGADDYVGTRWAVLITGFNRYWNYHYQVKKRTSNDNGYYGSHVMQYGDLKLNREDLFMGTNPANDSFTFVDDNSLRPSSNAISQQDASLLYFWETYRKAPEGSARKIKARKELAEVLSHGMHLDNSIELVGKLLFGIEKGSEVLKTVRPAGQPLVDDWQCFKTLIRTFETHCGSLSWYGLKHTRSIANFCNAGIREKQMSEVSAQACVTFPSNPWSSIQKRFSV